MVGANVSFYLSIILKRWKKHIEKISIFVYPPLPHFIIPTLTFISGPAFSNTLPWVALELCIGWTVFQRQKRSFDSPAFLLTLFSTGTWQISIFPVSFQAYYVVPPLSLSHTHFLPLGWLYICMNANSHKKDPILYLDSSPSLPRVSHWLPAVTSHHWYLIPPPTPSLFLAHSPHLLVCHSLVKLFFFVTWTFSKRKY